MAEEEEYQQQDHHIFSSTCAAVARFHYVVSHAAPPWVESHDEVRTEVWPLHLTRAAKLWVADVGVWSFNSDASGSHFNT